MVKVLIDGKEFEAKEVRINESYSVEVMTKTKEHGSAGFQGTNLDYAIFKDKPKQDFVEVPKEIQFVQAEIGQLGLLINNHGLFWYGESWAFVPQNVMNMNNSIEKIADCVLVPVKREELKAVSTQQKIK